VSAEKLTNHQDFDLLYSFAVIPEAPTICSGAYHKAVNIVHARSFLKKITSICQEYETSGSMPLFYFQI